jgi:hypothetical protein
MKSPHLSFLALSGALGGSQLSATPMSLTLTGRPTGLPLRLMKPMDTRADARVGLLQRELTRIIRTGRQSV